MIAGLHGTIEARLQDALLVNVHGVIYRVGTSTPTISDAGDEGDPVRLYTHLVVREDALTLYGFLSQDELRFFETLIGVSGIGPRLACAMLSTFQPARLLETVEAGSVDLLATVPGVGKKTAARLVVELRGKLPAAEGAVPVAAAGDADVIEALKSLGYSAAEAGAAISRAGAMPNATVEERIVAALRELAEG